MPETARFFAEAVPGRRGEILDAAMTVFAERGYDRGSMRDVAARVGVTEPALYRYFPSKEALFAAVMEGVAGALRDNALALMDEFEASQLRQQLLALLADRRRSLEAYGPVLRTALTASAHHPVFLERFRRTIVVPIRGHLTETTERLDREFGVSDGAEDRAERVRAAMALLVGAFVTDFVMSDAPDEAVADALMRAMRWA